MINFLGRVRVVVDKSLLLQNVGIRGHSQIFGEKYQTDTPVRAEECHIANLYTYLIGKRISNTFCNENVQNPR